MVAGFSFSHHSPNSAFFVTIYDLSTYRLQNSYRLLLGDLILRKNQWDGMGASNGRLVCFVSI